MKIDLTVYGPNGNVTTVLDFADEDSAMDFLARNALKGDVHACVHVYTLENVRFPVELVKALRNHYSNDDGDFNKVGCIKLLREMTGAGLKEAKDFAEANIFN